MIVCVCLPHIVVGMSDSSTDITLIKNVNASIISFLSYNSTLLVISRSEHIFVLSFHFLNK